MTQLSETHRGWNELDPEWCRARKLTELDRAEASCSAPCGFCGETRCRSHKRSYQFSPRVARCIPTRYHHRTSTRQLLIHWNSFPHSPYCLREELFNMVYGLTNAIPCQTVASFSWKPSTRDVVDRMSVTLKDRSVGLVKSIKPT